MRRVLSVPERGCSSSLEDLHGYDYFFRFNSIPSFVFEYYGLFFNADYYDYSNKNTTFFK